MILKTVTNIITIFIIISIFFTLSTTILDDKFGWALEPVENVEAQTPDKHPVSMAGTLTVDSDMRFMFGQGGGVIKVTLEGSAASELRRRIDSEYYLTFGSPTRNNSKVDGSLSLEGSEIGVFVELVEDRLEKGTITNNYELVSKENGTYEGVFAGIDITRKGGSEGVDITSVKGLSDTGTSSSAKITIKIKFGGGFAGGSGAPKLSNGEIIFFALFGYEPDNWNILKETKPNIKCKEQLSSIIVGMGSYNGANKDEGDFSKKRLLAGEVIKFSQEYQIGSDDKSGYLLYEPSNIIQNSLVLAIFGLILSAIMLSLPRTYYKRSGREMKIQWVHFMGIGFFIVLLLLYLFGIDGLSIWIGAPIMTAVTGITAARLYSKPEDKAAINTAGVTNRFHKMGLEEYRKGDLNKALNYFERALENNMKDEIIWNDKGHVLRKLEQYDEALKCFNLALSINPDFENAKRNKQLTLRDKRNARN